MMIEELPFKIQFEVQLPCSAAQHISFQGTGEYKLGLPAEEKMSEPLLDGAQAPKPPQMHPHKHVLLKKAMTGLALKCEKNKECNAFGERAQVPRSLTAPQSYWDPLALRASHAALGDKFLSLKDRLEVAHAAPSASQRLIDYATHELTDNTGQSVFNVPVEKIGEKKENKRIMMMMI